MAWALVKSGEVQRIINTPVALTVSGVSHPKSIFTKWSKEQLKGIGILPYEETQVDNRYYWSGNVSYSVGPDKVVGSYEGTARDVDALKASMLASVKSIAGSLLASTDWMVVRAAEGGTAIPEAVATYRAAIRTESNEKETAINALSTIADVIAFENAEYTEVRKVRNEPEEEGGEVTYGPETESFTRTINKATYFFAVNPLADEDPSFVSLTAA
jgi:hypothetical protein